MPDGLGTWKLVNGDVELKHFYSWTSDCLLYLDDQLIFQGVSLNRFHHSNLGGVDFLLELYTHGTIQRVMHSISLHDSGTLNYQEPRSLNI